MGIGDKEESGKGTCLFLILIGGDGVLKRVKGFSILILMTNQTHNKRKEEKEEEECKAQNNYTLCIQQQHQDQGNFYVYFCFFFSL